MTLPLSPEEGARVEIIEMQFGNTIPIFSTTVSFDSRSPMFTYASFPVYFPNTDINVIDMEVRIFASGDDKSMWDVQFNGADERWHTASAEQARAILKHVETNDVSAWGDITAQSRVNPTLAA